MPRVVHPGFISPRLRPRFFVGLGLVVVFVAAIPNTAYPGGDQPRTTTSSRRRAQPTERHRRVTSTTSTTTTTVDDRTRATVVETRLELLPAPYLLTLGPSPVRLRPGGRRLGHRPPALTDAAAAVAVTPESPIPSAATAADAEETPPATGVPSSVPPPPPTSSNAPQSSVPAPGTSPAGQPPPPTAVAPDPSPADRGPVFPDGSDARSIADEILSYFRRQPAPRTGDEPSFYGEPPPGAGDGRSGHGAGSSAVPADRPDASSSRATYRRAP